MPRPGNPDIRRRLLASGLELFYARGVNATGVKEIADRAHVPKAAFYTYYESKEAFVVAVLEQYWLELQDRSGSLLLGRGRPVRRLQRYFAVIADEHERHTFMRGCLIGNLALEVSATMRRSTKSYAALFVLGSTNWPLFSQRERLNGVAKSQV
ncbi:TetR/AcrR family transcriptional regulator [Mycobacterium lentiflavum]|uniref:TetR/AcrR family transcriptional regulator n=1 Tax=Mycobacterium lentiflavum TaxID=141349 RepID=A0ABY3UYV4_MYCLN|nr:TetR/AcrR family transcriptional regulator [Mycobacterium lentiflavum]ULP43912.1 TetR/AcrR family transcriptional regulator [Mycobacterium lentiflavum]